MHWFVEDDTELTVGSELILFLWDRSWSGWGEFSFAHSYQAAYYVPSSIEDFEITALEGEVLKIELESVNEGFNDAFITLEDLVEIAEYNDLIELLLIFRQQLATIIEHNFCKDLQLILHTDSGINTSRDFSSAKVELFINLQII